MVHQTKFVWLFVVCFVPFYVCLWHFTGSFARLSTRIMFNRCLMFLLFSNLAIWAAHDKTNKMTVRPAKTQICLGIHPVCSESSLCAQWVAKDPSFLHADSKDSNQTGRMPCWFCHEVAHLMASLTYTFHSSDCRFHLHKNPFDSHILTIYCNKTMRILDHYASVPYGT